MSLPVRHVKECEVLGRIICYFSNPVKELKVYSYEWVILNVIVVIIYDFP